LDTHKIAARGLPRNGFADMLFARRLTFNSGAMYQTQKTSLQKPLAPGHRSGIEDLKGADERFSIWDEETGDGSRRLS
jgi:hypothetical protein